LIFLNNFFGNIFRIFSRIFKPEGIFLSFVGADGAGKTTLINYLDSITSKFTTGKTFSFSFKPGILKKLNEIKLLESENKRSFQDVQNRWSGKLFSVLRLTYYSLDYLIGYYVKVLPILIGNGTVIADRYFYDYFFHKKRYNIHCSTDIITFFFKIIPKTNINFCIIADESEIYSRKQELTLDEIKFQQEKIKLMPKIVVQSIIVVNSDLNKSKNQILDEIIKWKIKKLKKY
jgi:thymidylate kinase